MRKELIQFKENPNISILFHGSHGLFMEEEAKELAICLLNTTDRKLPYHPDYLFIECGDEKSIGVDKVELILQKASYIPAVAAKTVIQISEIDKMTEQAQNKMLKLIEENSSVIIVATSYNNEKVLNTVKSRCRQIQYTPYSRDQFFNYCTTHQINDADILYFVTAGCPGLINENCQALTIFKEVSHCIRMNSLSNLLQILNIKEEKDPNNFFSKYRDLVGNLYLLIMELLLEKKIAYMSSGNIQSLNSINDTSLIIEEHYSRFSKVSYTKDNFFLCMAELITLIH